MLFKHKCSAHVRHDHALFNKLMRVISHERNNVFYLALCVKHKFHFLRFKLNSTAFGARLFKAAIQIVQVTQMRHVCFVALVHFFVALQNFPYLVISKASVRIHNSFIKLELFKNALRTNGHLTHHAQAVYFRIKRAQTVR